MTTRNRPQGYVPMRLDLAAPDRDRVRVEAAKHGLSMASYLRKVVLERLDQDRARRPRHRHQDPDQDLDPAPEKKED